MNAKVNQRTMRDGKVLSAPQPKEPNKSKNKEKAPAQVATSSQGQPDAQAVSRSGKEDYNVLAKMAMHNYNSLKAVYEDLQIRKEMLTTVGERIQ